MIYKRPLPNKPKNTFFQSFTSFQMNAKPFFQSVSVYERKRTRSWPDMPFCSQHACIIWQWWWLLLLHSAILCSWADSQHSHVILREWLAFYSVFLISTKVVCLQHWHGWCHMKLLPSQHKFCVHHTTMHHVTSCKATYVRSIYTDIHECSWAWNCWSCNPCFSYKCHFQLLVEFGCDVPQV